MPPNRVSPFFRCLRGCPYFTYTYCSTMIVNSSRTFIWSSSSYTQTTADTAAGHKHCHSNYHENCFGGTMPSIDTTQTAVIRNTLQGNKCNSSIFGNSERELWISMNTYGHKIVENILQCLSFVCCPHQKCRWRNIPSSSERKMTATISVCGPDM